ncbi:MAG: hypothetical protein WA667_12220 [Candidatus Nitrosopolaris sp.]
MEKAKQILLPIYDLIKEHIEDNYYWIDVFTLAEIGSAMVAVGEIEKVFALRKDDQLLSEIAQHLAESGKLDHAQRLTKKIKNLYSRSSVLSYIVLRKVNPKKILGFSRNIAKIHALFMIASEGIKPVTYIHIEYLVSANRPHCMHFDFLT